MELHKKIVVARKKIGLTQEQLAHSTNISVRTIQRIESGDSVPRAYTIKAIAAALNTTFEELTADSDTNNFSTEIVTPASYISADDKHFLQILCLSCFSYLVIPLMHFLIPGYILQRSKKYHPGVIAYSRRIIRTQIYWTVSLSFLLLLNLTYNLIIATHFERSLLINFIWTFLLMYIINTFMILITLWRIESLDDPLIERLSR